MPTAAAAAVVVVLIVGVVKAVAVAAAVAVTVAVVFAVAAVGAAAALRAPLAALHTVTVFLKSKVPGENDGNEITSTEDSDAGAEQQASAVHIDPLRAPACTCARGPDST